MRLLIFTVLFAPLALLVVMIPGAVRNGVPHARVVWDILPIAYVFATLPGWASAFVDWGLRGTPMYVRLFLTPCSAGCFAILFALNLNHGMSMVEEFVLVGLAGAIPAAICSLLSQMSKRNDSDTGWRLSSRSSR